MFFFKHVLFGVTVNEFLMDVNSWEDVFQLHHDIGPMFVLENIHICILTLPESSATGCFVFVRLPYLTGVSILETQTTSA